MNTTSDIRNAFECLLDAAWSYEADNGSAYCAGCGRDAGQEPGFCGSIAPACAVVRACVVLGRPVGQPFDVPKREAAPYTGPLGPFTDEGALPSQMDGVYTRTPEETP